VIQIVRQRMLKANGCQKNSFNDVKRLQITVLIATIIRGHDGERCLIYCRCLFVGSSTAAAAAAASPVTACCNKRKCCQWYHIKEFFDDRNR